MLDKILRSIATSCGILRNNLELPVFYSMLGLVVQTLNKLGIILDKKQNNNHQLNCTANANTSKNCHHLNSLSVNFAL